MVSVMVYLAFVSAGAFVEFAALLNIKKMIVFK